jgi:hypothetical protein
MKRKPPQITNAPGINWQPRSGGQWKALWRARGDIVARGYRIKSCTIWIGTPDELDEANILWIQTRANDLQNDMLVWSRGGAPTVAGTFDGSLDSLIMAYKNDPDSPYHKKRYVTRKYYDRLLGTLSDRHGSEMIADIKGRTVLRWHEEWSSNGRVAMGHALVGMLRTIVNFGITILESEECERLGLILSKQRYAMSRARNEALTAEMANAIRAKAHEMSRPSIALAQALQFELMLRQKDVIGEWVPIAEPGMSDVTNNLGSKWLRGLRWEEIDQNLILRHVTSKRGKPIEVCLRDAPMVMEELDRQFPEGLPASGPVILYEKTGRPWNQTYFRQAWRKVADECGIPKTVRNMDSRAGAITEATDAGADLEHVRHAATHSDIGMTQRYSRGGADKTANVMRLRSEHRNKART